MDLKKENGLFESPPAGSGKTGVAKETAETQLLKFLEGMKRLTADWDGEGAKQPDSVAVDDAKGFVRQLFLLRPNTSIEQACPGPMGEIAIELRNGSKSMEFLFYPQKKWKYVSVGGQRPAEQGIFELKNLSQLITWLHETEQ